MVILKENNKYFNVFRFISERFKSSTARLLTLIKSSARKKFVERCKEAVEGIETTDVLYSFHDDSNPNHYEALPINYQHIYIDDRYNMEKKFMNEKEESEWLDKDLTGILDFIKTLCQGCYKPAQIFLRNQMDEGFANIVNNRDVGTYSSIDIISTIVDTFIEVIQELKDYIYVDTRSTDFITNLLDCLLELVYGPRIENQMVIAK